MLLGRLRRRLAMLSHRFGASRVGGQLHPRYGMLLDAVPKWRVRGPRGFSVYEQPPMRFVELSKRRVHQGEGRQWRRLYGSLRLLERRLQQWQVRAGQRRLLFLGSAMLVGDLHGWRLW